LIDDLIDIVSKNGCLLLNIGPRADGSIPEEAVTILEEIGAWLSVNGEAVYDTRPWLVYGEGPTKVNQGHHSEKKNKDAGYEDIRFTVNGDTLYATALGWPEDGVFTVETLRQGAPELERSIRSVELISGSNAITWKQTSECLHIQVAGDAPCAAAIAFRIEFD
jgi:alpha-L-fucosidase